MEAPDRAPAPGRPRYVCPHCDAFASQDHYPFAAVRQPNGVQRQVPEGWTFTFCGSCGDFSIWYHAALTWPTDALGQRAHPDMPSNVHAIYEEARAIGARSPRSAAALLRLSLEQLVNDLEPGSGSLNDKIGQLVAKGLDPALQQAMDALRVYGNNGAHIGEIDLADGQQTVDALFWLLNIVVEQVVTRPKRIAQLYEALPPGAIDSIQRRDGRP